MNSNTISAASPVPSAAGGTSSIAEWMFADAASNVLSVRVPAKRIANKLFRLKAFGKVVGGTTTNFTVRLFVGADATVASNSPIFSTATPPVNSTSSNWTLQADLLLDDASGNIVGLGKGHVNATAVAQAITTAVNVSLSDVNADGSAWSADVHSGAPVEKVLVFGVSGKFSASHANNSAVLMGYELEAL